MPTPSEHPLPSVRSSLVPETLVYLKVFFEEPGQPTLEEQVDLWVNSTGNLIVMPSPPGLNSAGQRTVAVTYVKAVQDTNDPGK